ncbi:MAG: ABC transporter permease subunit [Anaeroplasmataceae bacterium]|nr:ABC transporter permease subunit [Anaeroplasmataceae bacterium]MDE6047553.1 ABC transporter permease subunit [Anaeroplasmataceae bacterium]MDE6242264.1 ABC transporter permease subunit [Anaeroplasmataceae bacterium]MDE7385447.1 ABC transporter permease subunit [Anaeroplasmataceae bacterium]
MEKVVDQKVVDQVEREHWKRTLRTLAKDWRLYVLLIPMLAFLLLYKYLPIAGILQGFKWKEAGQFRDDQWSGLFYAQMLFTGSFAADFWRAFRNTFVNSMYGLLFGFPIPIFLALLFSEIKNDKYRSVLQVCCYLPHFVSAVVVTTLITLWCQRETASNSAGIINQMLSAMGMNSIKADVLAAPRFFRPIYQISGVWEGAGYGSIVYFAAVMAISPTNYEAARIDGASKMQQIRYVTLPGMAPTLTIMLIMRIGQILNVGYEKIILLVGDQLSSYETSEVISTFVYRCSGRSENNQITIANGAAQNLGVVADIFNSLIAMCLVLGANAISRRVSSTSLF